jgi:hypothetical protein
MRVKNIDTVTATYQGQQLTASQVYTLEANEIGKWATDDAVIDAISDAKLQIGNDTEFITGTANQINALIGKSPTDASGRVINRTSAAEQGSTYLAHPIEIETSKLNGCYSSDHTGTSRTDFTMRFYNSSDVELVAGTQAELDSNCVKTVVTFKPQYDYEIVGGHIHQNSTPTTDVRIWVTGGMFDASDLPVSAKEFVSGFNLYFMGAEEQIETDGRASKYMKQVTTGAPYDTNTLQFIIRHNTGINHRIMFVTEYFRA